MFIDRELVKEQKRLYGVVVTRARGGYYKVGGILYLIKL